MKNNYSIRVLERAQKILNCFTLEEPEKSLMDLSLETKLHKSTVFRILETLEGLRWVQQDPKTGLYYLGTGIFELGSRAVNGLDLYKVSRPHLEKLLKSTGQTVHLVIHADGEVLYLNKLESPGSFIAQPSHIGLRMPMHCTAVGKVLLAYMEKERVEQIIEEKGLPKLTPNTTTSKKSLWHELDKIKNRGYALDDEEIQLGLRCVAAPLCGYNEKVIAAVSVSGLVSNLCDKRLPFIIREVMQVASAISRDLGCPKLNYVINSMD